MYLAPTAHRLFERLKESARAYPKRIVFPEGNDPRVMQAAQQLREENLVKPILLTEPIPDATLADLYYARRRSRGITVEEATRMAAQPLYRAALMVAAGQADGCVGGAINTTGETVRAALQCIGLAPGCKLVSSAFLIALPQPGFGSQGLFCFADCAVVVEPDSEQLAEIAIAAAQTTRALIGAEAAVALLSFSTHGSANHEKVDLVRNALLIARERDPHLRIDGELQADAAIIEQIGLVKAPGSRVTGHTNTLIFPT